MNGLRGHIHTLAAVVQYPYDLSQCLPQRFNFIRQNTNLIFMPQIPVQFPAFCQIQIAESYNCTLNKSQRSGTSRNRDKRQNSDQQICGHAACGKLRNDLVGSTIGFFGITYQNKYPGTARHIYILHKFAVRCKMPGFGFRMLIGTINHIQKDRILTFRCQQVFIRIDQIHFCLRVYHIKLCIFHTGNLQIAQHFFQLGTEHTASDIADRILVLIIYRRIHRQTKFSGSRRYNNTGIVYAGLCVKHSIAQFFKPFSLAQCFADHFRILIRQHRRVPVPDIQSLPIVEGIVIFHSIFLCLFLCLCIFLI